jgi:hypothetical protein
MLTVSHLTNFMVISISKGIYGRHGNLVPHPQSVFDFVSELDVEVVFI